MSDPARTVACAVLPSQSKAARPSRSWSPLAWPSGHTRGRSGRLFVLRQPRCWCCMRCFDMPRFAAARSGVDAARQCGLGHATDGQHVRRQSQVDVVLDCGAMDVLERADHHAAQASVDLVDRPEELLTVLDPLEITDGDTARIAQNV